MDSDVLHFECTQMVKKTQSTIFEVDKKMRNLLSESTEELSNTQMNSKDENIQQTNPIWLRCLLWFCMM
tara:strand:+ start:43 stop:249 length:207 start_codon:yes stop_codon:yes gene_type:complete